jgi:8-oxo-dGTP pyrophosphatase MutT (NUDIX family)
MNHIRPLAICVFLHNNRILVAEGYDSVKSEYFYRPLGGGIEFGESSQETICRELMEELKLEVDKSTLIYLGTLENIFTFNDHAGHEIVLIYDGAFQEHKVYEQVVIRGQEANGENIRAIWMGLDEFGDGKSILYPTGLVEMLLARTSHDIQG